MQNISYIYLTTLFEVLLLLSLLYLSVRSIQLKITEPKRYSLCFAIGGLLLATLGSTVGVYNRIIENTYGLFFFLEISFIGLGFCVFALGISRFLKRMKFQIATAKQDAITDILTGVTNRKGFMMRLNNAINNSNITKKPFVLVMLDLNDFKRINDTFGHQIGDYILQKVTKIMQDKIRDNDIICRYGGDEFAVILENTNPETASEIIDRLNNGLSEFIISNGTRLSFSAGMAIYPDDTRDIHALIKIADQRMYSCKRKVSTSSL